MEGYLATSLRSETWSDTLNPIVQKILNNVQLTEEDGVALFNEPNLFELGKLALFTNKQCLAKGVL